MDSPRICTGIPYMQNMTKSKSNPVKKQERPAKKAPVARGVIARAERPSLTANGTGIRVQHREFVGSATNGENKGYHLTDVSEAIPGYDINPGNAKLFPWLSGLAGNFERFRFTRLCLRFIPSQPTTTAGRFYAAVDYDYDDAVAANKAQLLGNATALDVPVWMEASLELDPRQLHPDMPWKYVSLSSRSNFVEPRTAYCGFLMCAYDTQAEDLTYDIWAEYVVEFQLPVVEYSVVYGPDSTTGSYAAISNITSVGSGSTKGGAIPITALLGAPLKTVVPGSGGVPPLAVTALGGSIPLPAAIDLLGAKPGSVLTMLHDISVTGVTPATLLGTNDAKGRLYGFDAQGFPVPEVASTLESVVAQVGPLTASQISTAGALSRSVSTWFLSQLLALYPTLRYVSAITTSNGALGAGAGGCAFKFEL